MKVKKAVIPAAGLGTRFLPSTKAQPKEMMNIFDKPAIQYIVEEAVNSGIEDILIILGRNKNSIEDHFDKSYELEDKLRIKGKDKVLREIEKIGALISYFLGKYKPVKSIQEQEETEELINKKLLEDYGKDLNFILNINEFDSNKEFS